jgi:hypothetical protein
MSEEYVISLVVESNHSPAIEFWIMREDGRQQTTNRVSQASVEIIQYHLGHVCSRLTTSLQCNQ